MNARRMGNFWGMVCCAALIVACGGSDEVTNNADSGGTDGSGTFPDPAAPKTGCGTLTEEEARSIVTTNLETVARGALDAMRFAEGSAALARALSFGSSGKLVFVADTEKSIDDMVGTLEAKTLASGNFEAAEGSSVTFRMQPDVVCPPTAEELAENPERAAEREASCRDGLAKNEERVRVTRIDCENGDSVEMAFLFGPEPLVPLVLELHPSSLSLSYDVEKTARLNERQGNFAEDVLLDSNLAGVLGAQITLGPSGTVDFALDAVNDVNFGVSGAQGSRLSFAAAAAKLLRLSADPGKQQITGRVDAKAVGFEQGLESFIRAFLEREPTELVTPSDYVTFRAPGLQGNFSYSAESDALTVTGLALTGAPATFRYGDVTLLTIDWNTAAQRALDFVLAPSGEDVSLTLGKSGLDLQLEYSMSVLADRVVDQPEFTKDDTLRIKLGPNAPALLFANPDPDVDDLLITDAREGALLRVESGRLELTSRAVPTENVVVDAGQCLLRDPNVVGEHAFLGSLSAGTCQ